MELPIVSDELVHRIRERQRTLIDGAQDVVSRAVTRRDPHLTAAASSHFRELAAHLGLVDALLDALTPDAPSEGR